MTRFTATSHGSLATHHGAAARFSGLLAALRPRHHGLDRMPIGAAPAEPVQALEEDPVRGPGWFDSSWDLSRGLEVREGLPGDAKLNEWIESCLRA
jgi:hypothetical protein